MGEDRAESDGGGASAPASAAERSRLRAGWSTVVRPTLSEGNVLKTLQGEDGVKGRASRATTIHQRA